MLVSSGWSPRARACLPPAIVDHPPCGLSAHAARPGRTISGAYAVTQGSHMDIDMRVYNPKSLVVFEALREGEGKFTIPADADGSYKLCFSNKMSMVSHKTVKLVVDNGDGPDLTGLAKKEHMDSVEQTLITIAHSARMIAFHQEEYRQLHDRHLVSTFLSGGRWACIAVVGWNLVSRIRGRPRRLGGLYWVGGMVIVVGGGYRPAWYTRRDGSAS